MTIRYIGTYVTINLKKFESAIFRHFNFQNFGKNTQEDLQNN